MTNNLLLHQKIVQTATDYTVLSDDMIIEVTDTSAIRTITLPSPSIENVGKFYIIKDTSGAAAAHTISIVSLSGTIDGAASLEIGVNHGSAQVYSDGTNYFSQTLSSPTIHLMQSGFLFLSNPGAIPGNGASFSVGIINWNTVPANSASRIELSTMAAISSATSITVGNRDVAFTQAGIYLIQMNSPIVASTLGPSYLFCIQLIKNGTSVLLSLSFQLSLRIQIPMKTGICLISHLLQQGIP